jgi:hypothetical protein
MQHEPWVGDRVLYSVGNEPPQEAEIIAIIGNTDGGVRILSGPQKGQELVVPWGIIEPIGNIWHRFDPNNISTHPEDNWDIELQYSDRRVFRGI